MSGTLLLAVWLGVCTWGWPGDALAQASDLTAAMRVPLSGRVMTVDPTPYAEQQAEWKKAEGLWQKGKSEEAVKAFDKCFKSLKEKPEEAAALALRVAELLRDQGKCQDALAWFGRASGESSPVRNWARFGAGQCLRTLKRAAEAAEMLGRVEPWFANRALALRCQCMALLEAGKKEEFLQCAANHRKVEGPDPKLVGEEARVLRESGQAVLAAESYRLLASAFPTASESVGALQTLKELEGKADKAAELTLPEWVQRGAGYYERHKFQSATQAADTLLGKAKAQTPEWCEALGIKGSALAKSGRQTDSLVPFGQYLEKCESYYRDTYFYRAAEAARSAGKAELASQFAETLVKRFPQSSLCDDALLFEAVALSRAGQEEKAHKVLERLLEAYPKGDMASEAAFQLVFDLYQGKKYAQVVELTAKLVPALPEREDYRTDGRLTYWAARALTQVGKKKDARKLYREILEKYPLSWYGLLAYSRLESFKRGAGAKAMDAVRKASQPLLPTMAEVLQQAPADLPNLATGVVLLRAGLTDEARSEFGVAFNAVGVSTLALHLLEAALYHAGGHIDLSHQVLRREVPDFAYSWPQPDDDRWWMVAYPQGFPELLKAEAEKQNVPWCLVMAVMREESGFNPEIVSYANAVGLLQILPKTASGVAKKKVSPEQLKIPSVNIPLGVEYFGGLLKKFRHPALAAAGYNSGPGGVRKTFDRYAGTELDEWVESVPYDQTRRYTKRVVSSAWRYHVLYGDKGWRGISLRVERP